jgi:hypothetical protein
VTRDVDRQRVYDAEVAAFGGTTLDEPLAWDGVVAIIHAVTHHSWWRALDVPDPLVRRARSDAGRSSADGRTIRLADDGRTPLTAAHELAHHLVAAHHGPDVEPHGPEFRAAALRTVAVVGGDEARATLSAEWTRWGVPPGPWALPEPPAGPGLALRGVIAL